MQIRRGWLSWGLLITLIALGLGVSTPSPAAGATGTEAVPLTIIKANSQQLSAANQFFESPALTVETAGGRTLWLTTNAPKYIKKMTVAGATAQLVKRSPHYGIYQVSLATQQTIIPVTFALTTPMGNMTESARLRLDWSKATTVSTVTSPAAVIALATTRAANIKVKTPQPPKQAQASATASRQSNRQKAADSVPTTYRRYEVLQADKARLSEANRYYTHLARITRVTDGYRVTLQVAYAKKLQLGPKAVIPEVMDGQRVTDAQYGQTKTAETVTYSFTIKSLADLGSKLIPGTIHVKVPMANIDNTFTVRFRFAQKGASRAGAAPQVRLPSGKTTHADRATNAQKKLPQTNERWSVSWQLLGLGLSCMLGGLVWRRQDV